MKASPIQQTRSSARVKRINAMAEKARQKYNTLTDAKREALLQQGMSLIYGGGNERATHVRRH